ncbi:type VII secretion protein EsaA [Metabacillus fastidiosus]|uniref:type VII secretion protein EsaA n=1 Tax=Metabacillus fastidiosus TaxID=1458 RepID=UPI003D2819E7
MSENQNEKKSIYPIVKLISVMAIIFLLPTLFFSYIGHEPMKVEKKTTEIASREIAVVNEDDGAEYEKQPIYFGEKLSATFGESSEYNWSVVSRSAADKGLESGRYDAVIYLPSEFSKNILTFKEDTPLKANVKYVVQSNLDARNREKVQKELEISKNKMNSTISTLYWSYVSKSVNDLRKKFDGIVEKEVAFQTTMYSFYNPNSKKLTGEIDQQKKMLEALQESAKNIQSTTSETLTERNKTKEEIKTFLGNLNKYKEYQEKQAELFALTDQENLRLVDIYTNEFNERINTGIQKVAGVPTDENPETTLNGEGIKKNIDLIEENMTKTNDSLSAMYKLLSESAGNDNFEGFLKNQKELMEQYKQTEINNAMKELEQSIFASVEKLTKEQQNNEEEQTPEEGGITPPQELPELETPSDIPEVSTEVREPMEIPATEDNSVSVETLVTELNSLKESITQMKTTENEELSKKVDSHIEKLEKDIQALKENSTGSGQIEKEYNDILEQNKALAEALSLLEKNLELLESNNKALEEYNKQLIELGKLDEQGKAFQFLIGKINKVEETILNSKFLTYSTKSELSKKFEATILNTDLSELLEYYLYLVKYRAELEKLEKHDSEFLNEWLKNQQKTTEMKGVLDSIQAESEQALTNITASTEGIEAVKNAVTQTDENITKQQEAIVALLTELEGKTSDLTNKFNEERPSLEVDQSPVTDLHGDMVLTIQEGTLHDMKFISELVESLADRQSSVTDYTNELQSKVGSVQNKADELNNKWAKNVVVTKKVKGDIYDLLNNTLVDDQYNSYVYDYLSNPVKVSGNVPMEKSVEVVNTPPVVMLIIIMISGLLIGFFLHYYSYLPLAAHLPIFLLVNLIVGIIISIYGLKIYPLEDIQAMKWSIFTILLLFLCTSIVRLAFYIGPFVGWIVSILLTVYFLTPLLDLVNPNFAFEHPVSQTYMSLQYGTQSAFYPAVVILSIGIILTLSIPYIVNIIRTKDEDEHAEA